MILDVQNLHFDYPEQSVLHNVSFTVPEGCVLHLRGGNGAGKTTLLKLLAGLFVPSEGEIHYGEQSIAHDLPKYRESLCFIGHKTGVSSLLTVREQCYFDLQNHAAAPSVNEIMTTFALEGLMDVPCGLLSVGQQRRVALTRLLMSRATLWLLDEPFAALDAAGMEVLMRCLNTHLLKGGQAVLTSHQPVLVGHGVNYQVVDL